MRDNTNDEKNHITDRVILFAENEHAREAMLSVNESKSVDYSPHSVAYSGAVTSRLATISDNPCSIYVSIIDKLDSLWQDAQYVEQKTFMQNIDIEGIVNMKHDMIVDAIWAIDVRHEYLFDLWVQGSVYLLHNDNEWIEKAINHHYVSEINALTSKQPDQTVSNLELIDIFFREVCGVSDIDDVPDYIENDGIMVFIGSDSFSDCLRLYAYDLNCDNCNEFMCSVRTPVSAYYLEGFVNMELPGLLHGSIFYFDGYVA